ncbi:Condensin-2 complex subunit D3, partial [Geodia barretti]
MSLQKRTLEAFKLLGVEELPEDWVGRCWEENFCENSPLPSQVREDVLSVRTWRAVVDVCRKWLTATADGGGSASQDSETEEPGPGLWTTLVECGVSHRALLALIFSILDRNSQSVEEVGRSVCAAQTYLCLLRLPGSTAFKTFQPIIFQKALNVVYVLSGTRAGRGEGRGRGGEGGRGRRGEGGRKG